MSYPKKHPTQVSPDQRLIQKLQKKEQLKQIVINKFRVKYGIKPEQVEIDSYIRQQVEFIMEEEGQMNENNLRKLDSDIAMKLGLSTRKKDNYASVGNNNDDAPQLKSSASVRSFRSNLLQSNAQNILNAKQKNGQQSQLRNSMPMSPSGLNYDNFDSLDINDKVNNDQKMVMTDDAWNEIIKFNTEQFQKEKEMQKQIKEDQKKKLKEELAKQVEQKRISKMQEQKEFSDFIKKQRDQLAQDEMRETMKQQAYKTKVMQDAFEREQILKATQQMKMEELQKERMNEEQKRRKMEKETFEEQQRFKEKMENFKKQCAQQLSENKAQRDLMKLKEKEEDNKPPSGRDLMAQIYEEKKHISYEKRARNDKILAIISEQVTGGESYKRIQQEESSMNNYIKKKQMQDMTEDERRRKIQKDKELEMKRILDLQLKERDEKHKLKKIEDVTEAKYIMSDVAKFQNEQDQKKKNFENYVQSHHQKLVKQIQDKQQPQQVQTQDLLMNKSLIKQIAAQKQLQQ